MLQSAKRSAGSSVANAALAADAKAAKGGSRSGGDAKATASADSGAEKAALEVQRGLIGRLTQGQQATATCALQQSLATSGLKAWLGWCDRLRRPAMDAMLDAGRPPASMTDRLVAFCLPTQFRPLAVYSPLKAAAWRAALLLPDQSDAWYPMVHVEGDLALSAACFAAWRESREARAAVAANLRWLVTLHRRHRQKVGSNPPRAASGILATAVQWHRALQAAYEFALPNLFDELLTLCHADRNWSPDELALFSLIW